MGDVIVATFNSLGYVPVDNEDHYISFNSITTGAYLPDVDLADRATNEHWRLGSSPELCKGTRVSVDR